MKRYLFYCMVLAVTITAFTGCSKNVYDPERPEKDAWELYRKNFLAYLDNQISRDVDWGFDATKKAQTRAVKATITLDDDYPLLFDANYFKMLRQYFPEGGEKPKSTVNSWEFLQNGEYANLTLIYCNTKANDEIGLYYYDPATETPQQAQKYVLVQNIQEGLGKYYQSQMEDDSWVNPSTTDGYAVWDDGVKRIHTNCFGIEMDTTYRFGVYVKNADTGKTYYTNMNLNNNSEGVVYSGSLIGKDNEMGEDYENTYAFGLSDDGVPGCELLFVVLKTGEAFPKVVPYEEPKPEPEPVWYRIIAEDLNAHDLDKDGEVDDTDFDFNDIVLDVALTDKGADCKLQAAGATLKIRINGNDNLEVHKLFGVDQSQMVNTHASKAGLPGPDNVPFVEFSIEGSFKTVDDIPLQVYRQNKWMTLKSLKGDATSKIIVPVTFEWPDERVSLKAAYPNFLKYVQEPDKYKEWWNSEWK